MTDTVGIDWNRFVLLCDRCSQACCETVEVLGVSSDRERIHHQCMPLATTDDDSSTGPADQFFDRLKDCAELLKLIIGMHRRGSQLASRLAPIAADLCEEIIGQAPVDALARSDLNLVGRCRDVINFTTATVPFGRTALPEQVV